MTEKLSLKGQIVDDLVANVFWDSPTELTKNPTSQMHAI